MLYDLIHMWHLKNLCTLRSRDSMVVTRADGNRCWSKTVLTIRLCQRCHCPGCLAPPKPKFSAVPAVMIQDCALEKFCTVSPCDTHQNMNPRMGLHCVIYPCRILRKRCFNFHSESFLPSTQGSPSGRLCIMLSHPSLKPMANSSHSECVLRFFKA